jgi:hypothetical protein
MPENLLSLDEVKSHFEHWRMTRSKQRERIPEYLWNEVKILIDHYPMQDITQALRINTSQIKDNLKISTKINFVEVQPETSSTLTGQQIVSFQNNNCVCSIEFHRVNGGILKINALPVASLTAIITQFMG